jgi:tetratricopeptide (TPR) repeat protein
LSSSVESMCAMIPDFVEATKRFQSKNYKEAIPLYSRAYDILKNVMPADDDMACQNIVYQIAQSHVRSGQIAQAAAFIKSHVDLEKFGSAEGLRNVQMYCSLGLFLNSDWAQRASILGRINKESIKAQSDAEVFKQLLQQNHALNGVLEISAALHESNVELRHAQLSRASVLLQGALNFRPSDEGRVERLGILNNLGVCSALRCHRPVLFHPDALSKGGGVDTSADTPFYMDYFARTIDDVYASAGLTTETDLDEAADAQMEELRQQKVADLGALVDGMVHWLAAIDEAEAVLKDVMEEKCVLGMEETAQFVASYATVLTNCAVVDAYVGRRAEANTHMSCAIKLLNSHFDTYEKAGLPIDSVWRLLLARVLTMTACAHLHGTQAVTAEGLFRGSMDLYNQCSHDHRCKAEKVLTLHNYGKCLLKWEKREKTGADYQAEARDIIAAGAGAGAGDMLRPFPTSIIVPYIL